MRRSAPATVRRTVRRATTWRPKPAGTQTLDVRRLVSPFRYDVVVRRHLFEMLAAAPSATTDEVADAAWPGPYGTWFRQVAMPRFRPWVTTDPALLRSSFRERVESARRLLVSVTDEGFDVRRPVVLRTTTGPRRTDSGQLVTRRTHVGDGGHRLALLLHLGLGLQPEMHRLDPREAPVLDNTSTLLRHLRLSDAEHLGFVASGYSDAPCRDWDDVRAAAAATGPEALEELEGVLALHARIRAETS